LREFPRSPTTTCDGPWLVHFTTDSLQRTCSTDSMHQVGMTGVCGGCISDAECMTGMECVHTEFGNPAKEVGWYCQGQESAVSGHDCANAKPFVKTVPAPSSGDAPTVSIDGQTATICTLAVSTCPAYNDFRATSCTGLGAYGQCGFAYSSNSTEEQQNQDAYCAQLGASSYLCTMACQTDIDCPRFACNMTTHRCALQ
jgi:hypothetical protein